MGVLIQAISIVGLLWNVISFQQKNKKAFLVCQLGASVFFCIHFLMLGAYIGFLMNGISIFRAIAYSFDKIKDKYKNLLAMFFILMFFSAYIASFTVFRVDFSIKNSIIEILPIIGMSFATISFGMRSMGKIRVFSIINSISWLIYNVAHVSIGGILCEIFCLTSIIVGMIRYDRKIRE